MANSLRATEAPTTARVMHGSSLQTFRVGEMVAARHRIVRFISRGGMGEVYEAWDVQLQETIALKTIACTDLDNAKLLKRLRAEVQLARRVTHPNVCRILEFGLHDRDYRGQKETVPFFTMEYLKGVTLAQLMASRGIPSVSEVLPIVLQMIEGLLAVHAAGIVHRDLKPDNVFIISGETGTMRVVVMDFGLARSVTITSSLVSSSGTSPVGTPAYMAPEQAAGETPTVAWDIYALGVILFQLLSGRLPFKFKSNAELVIARKYERAPALSSLNPRISSKLESVVARCLEPDPQRRFANLEEVRKALSEATQVPHFTKRRLRTAAIWLSIAILGFTLVWLGVVIGHFRIKLPGVSFNSPTARAPRIVH
jgi:serine/threonine protein kinase